MYPSVVSKLLNLCKQSLNVFNLDEDHVPETRQVLSSRGERLANILSLKFIHKINKPPPIQNQNLNQL